MTAAMLQQPTPNGLADGIIDRDPWRLQCRECGRVETNPNGAERAAVFIILAGFLFCPRDGVRRCRDCRRSHAKVCDDGGCQAVTA